MYLNYEFNVMNKLPWGVLFHTIAPDMTPAIRTLCVDSWQKCDLSQMKQSLNDHKILQTLEYCFRQHQIWDDLPIATQQLIQKSRQQHGLRHLQVLAQLNELDTALSTAGEEAVLLKGSALLYYQLYPNLGTRGQSDIDIMVAPDRVSAIVPIIRALGYTFQGNYEEGGDYSHHLPPLVRPQSLHIEIHPLQSRLGEHIHQRMLETAETIDGFDALRLPIVTELFWHVALHGLCNVPQLRNLLDLQRLRRLYKIDDLLLADRARMAGLEPKWSMLMSQLAEFEQGKPSAETIQFWEWVPSKFQPIYGVWRGNDLSYFFSPVLRYPNQLIGRVLYLPVVAWRLIRLARVMGEYLLKSREFASIDRVES
jgi:Uncharacterised nucleotidyltransferase